MKGFTSKQGGGAWVSSGLGLAAAAAVLTALSGAANAATFNTNDAGVYTTFSTGATVEDFEGLAGVTPLALNSYANALNSGTAVPADAQLSLDIGGLLFHSGGGSFNDPVGNPGTPTALLSLNDPIAGDAHSPTNVVGSLEINTENLDLDNFLEIVFIDDLQDRVGVWLNPALGSVTFTAFDATGSSLESVQGDAGNFVGIQRDAADIRFVSIVGGQQGFTIDDLTFADGSTTDDGGDTTGDDTTGDDTTGDDTTTDTGTDDTDTGTDTDTDADGADAVDSAAIPEPATAALAALAVLALGVRVCGRRR